MLKPKRSCLCFRAVLRCSCLDAILRTIRFFSFLLDNLKSLFLVLGISHSSLSARTQRHVPFSSEVQAKMFYMRLVVILFWSSERNVVHMKFSDLITWKMEQRQVKWKWMKLCLSTHNILGTWSSRFDHMKNGATSSEVKVNEALLFNTQHFGHVKFKIWSQRKWNVVMWIDGCGKYVADFHQRIQPPILFALRTVPAS